MIHRPIQREPALAGLTAKAQRAGTESPGCEAGNAGVKGRRALTPWGSRGAALQLAEEGGNPAGGLIWAKLQMHRDPGGCVLTVGKARTAVWDT